MHEVFCLVMFEFPNRYAYVYVPVISSLKRHNFNHLFVRSHSRKVMFLSLRVS